MHSEEAVMKNLIRNIFKLSTIVFMVLSLSPVLAKGKAYRTVTVGKIPSITINAKKGTVLGLEKYVTITIKRVDKNRIKKKCNSIGVLVIKDKKETSGVNFDSIEFNAANFTKRIRIPMWKFAVVEFKLMVTKQKYDPNYSKVITYQEMATNYNEAKSALLRLNPQSKLGKFKLQINYDFSGIKTSITGRKRFKTDYKDVAVQFFKSNPKSFTDRGKDKSKANRRVAGGRK